MLLQSRRGSGVISDDEEILEWPRSHPPAGRHPGWLTPLVSIVRALFSLSSDPVAGLDSERPRRSAKNRKRWRAGLNQKSTNSEVAHVYDQIGRQCVGSR